MSRLEELIQTRCPDGVEFENLGDFASIDKGQQLNLTRMTDDLPYPVMNGGIKPSGYFDQYNTEENTIAISQGGASAGYINFIETKFWAGAHCYVVKPKKSTVVNKFLYYLLKNSETEIQNAKYGAGIPGLNKSTLEHLVLPIPPLQVQEEIVRILDTFSSVVAELEQKMNAEQAARVRQYEHYRDELLINNSDVPVIDLGNLCEFVRGPFGGSLKKEIFVNEGFAVYEQQHAIYGDFTFRYFIDQKKFNEMKRFQVKPGDLIMSCSGTMGKVSLIPKNAKEGIINQALLKLRVKNGLNKYFLKYFFESKAFINALNSRTQGGAIKNVASVAILKTIPIPVPPLEVQEQIVSILDRFDALVNDLKSGLPAEIALRRKQYEYYRDQLLTFKPLNDM